MNLAQPILVLWALAGLTAIMMLVKMMRRRQLHLIDLLKKHVELQAAWQRRKDRAEAMAAEDAAANEKKDKLAKRAVQIAEHTVDAAN